MKEKISLLGRRTYKINDKITIRIPTVRLVRGENIEDENRFWSDVGMFTASPDDLASELDKAGLDFTKISEWLLFVITFFARRDTQKGTPDTLFENFDLWDLELVQNGGEYALADNNGDIVIDEKIYYRLSELFSYITGHERRERLKFGNKITKVKWIENDRKKKERAAKKPASNSGVLDGIILRLVCCADFPYNFETINDVTIFDLIYSLKQIDKNNSVTDLMQNRFVGADLSKYSGDQLSRYVL